MVKMTVQVAIIEKKSHQFADQKITAKDRALRLCVYFLSSNPSLQSPQYEDFFFRQNRLNHVEPRLNIDHLSFSYREKIKMTDICYL